MITGVKRVSRPGRRVYFGRHEVPPVLAGLLWLLDRWQVGRGAVFRENQKVPIIRHGTLQLLRAPSGYDAALLLASVVFVVMYAAFAYVDIAWGGRSTMFLGVTFAICADYAHLPATPVAEPVAVRARRRYHVRDLNRVWTDAQRAYLDYRPEDYGLGRDAQGLFDSLARLFVPWIGMLSITVAFKAGEHVAIGMIEGVSAGFLDRGLREHGRCDRGHRRVVAVHRLLRG